MSTVPIFLVLAEDEEELICESVCRYLVAFRDDWLMDRLVAFVLCSCTGTAAAPCPNAPPLMI